MRHTGWPKNNEQIETCDKKIECVYIDTLYVLKHSLHIHLQGVLKLIDIITLTLGRPVCYGQSYHDNYQKFHPYLVWAFLFRHVVHMWLKPIDDSTTYSKALFFHLCAERKERKLKTAALMPISAFAVNFDVLVDSHYTYVLNRCQHFFLKSSLLWVG